MSLRPPQPSTAQTVDYLESLPDELLLPLLEKIPLSELSRLCRVSTRISGLCRDWTLWTHRAVRELHVSPAQFRQTTLTDPRQRYRQIQQAQQEAIEAVSRGQLARLQAALPNLYLPKPELSKFISELLAMAAKGPENTMKNISILLIEFAKKQLDWDVDLQHAIDNAETVGNYGMYVFLESQWQEQLNYFFLTATRPLR